MFLEQFGHLLRRFWLWVVAGAVICAAAGAGALALQPTEYRSQAASAVVTNARAADPGTVQALASTVMMSMPAYVAQATSHPVVAAAAKASGLTEADVQAGLETARTIDSTVLHWSMTSPDPEASRTALEAAVDEFSRLVEAGAARGIGEAPLTIVSMTGPAGDATARRLSPLLGLAGGAGLGAVLALLAAALVDSVRTPVNDWDSVELATDAPVLAELSPRARDRVRQLGYVAGYLADRGPVGNVLALGARTAPSSADLETLQGLLADRSPAGRAVVEVGELAAASTAARVSASDAVVVVIDRHRDDVREFAPDVRAIRRLSRGAVAIVLDTPRTARTRDRQPTPGGRASRAERAGAHGDLTPTAAPADSAGTAESAATVESTGTAETRAAGGSRRVRERASGGRRQSRRVVGSRA
ncbi:MAG: hypothetical protein Q4G51_06890 [Dermatophilus congolensis]|nr:hypothetical protein [Dermatophilus congolensis]